MSRSTLFVVTVATAALVSVPVVTSLGARPSAELSSSSGDASIAGRGRAGSSPTAGSPEHGTAAGRSEASTAHPRAGQPSAAPGSEATEQTGRRWQWPVRPRPAVLRPFRAPASTYGAGHRGLDLAAGDGAAVLAVEAGRVVHAGVVAGRGTVSVEHLDGLRSTYEPVAAAASVGEVVTAGDLLGRIHLRDGPSHCGPATCLHLGARRGAVYLDPLPLLTGGRVALLPLG